MIAYLALVIALVGLLLFVLASNPKLVRVGEILLFCGVLVFTWTLGNKTVRLF